MRYMSVPNVFLLCCALPSLSFVRANAPIYTAGVEDVSRAGGNKGRWEEVGLENGRGEEEELLEGLLRLNLLGGLPLQVAETGGKLNFLEPALEAGGRTRRKSFKLVEKSPEPIRSAVQVGQELAGWMDTAVTRLYPRTHLPTTHTIAHTIAHTIGNTIGTSADIGNTDDTIGNTGNSGNTGNTGTNGNSGSNGNTGTNGNSGTNGNIGNTTGNSAGTTGGTTGVTSGFTRTTGTSGGTIFGASSGTSGGKLLSSLPSVLSTRISPLSLLKGFSPPSAFPLPGQSEVGVVPTVVLEVYQIPSVVTQLA
eukprot:GHVS01077968.1.p1 GENE.GHVS01077968.1~~GHVS01077968.1.p1  ORF type:complete len:308 (-),score=59.92 GHVS01077968.1:75-998(-)